MPTSEVANEHRRTGTKRDGAYAEATQATAPVIRVDCRVVHDWTRK